MLEIRPLVAGEEHLFLSLIDKALVGVQAFERDYLELVALNQYRPQWTWVALRDGVVVVRAAWWGAPDADEPIALDWFDFLEGEEETAAELLREAGFGAEYCVLLPPGWRDRPEVRAAAERRIDAATRAGMSPFVERLRYRWTPGNGLPPRPGRLVFRPEPDDERIFAILRRTVVGSLDAHERRAHEKGGVDAAAKEEMDFLRWMPSPREWWRVAYTRDGEVVGLSVPGRNYASAVIGIICVVPEHRGNGYAYDLLVEATHLLVGEGADAITAETDTTNTPMAATFAKTGYPIVQERFYLQ